MGLDWPHAEETRQTAKRAVEWNPQGKRKRGISSTPGVAQKWQSWRKDSSLGRERNALSK